MLLFLILVNLVATYGQRPVTDSHWVSLSSSFNSKSLQFYSYRMEPTVIYKPSEEYQYSSTKTYQYTSEIPITVLNLPPEEELETTELENSPVIFSDIPGSSSTVWKVPYSSRIIQKIPHSSRIVEEILGSSNIVQKEIENSNTVQTVPQSSRVVQNYKTVSKIPQDSITVQRILQSSKAVQTQLQNTRTVQIISENSEYLVKVPESSKILQDKNFSTSLLEISIPVSTGVTDQEILSSIIQNELQYFNETTWSPPLDVTAPIRISGKQSKEKSPTLYDIIGGIIHLFETENGSNKTEISKVPQEKSVFPSRKNDRGPPKTYPSNTDKAASLTSEIQPSSVISDSFMTTMPFSSVLTHLVSSIDMDSKELDEDIIVETSMLPDMISSSLTSLSDVQSENLVSSIIDLEKSSIIDFSSIEIVASEDIKNDEEIYSISEIISSYSEVPNGPITDWVPLIVRPSIKSKLDSSQKTEDLPIITEPSIFDITITNSVGHSDITRDFPAEHFIPTITASSFVPNMTEEISSSIPDYDTPNEEAAEIDEIIVTLLGSGTMKSETSTTTAPSNPGPATGRPYVIPVDIEEVRPFIGAQIPPPRENGRPNSHVQVAVAGINVADENSGNNSPSLKHPSLLRPARPRPTPPIIRIDTCIVGDDTTCDSNLNEYCKAEQGISSCQCRPGYARTFPRGPCQAVVSILVSIRIDRIGEQKLVFNRNYLDPGNQIYQQMEYEARQAINSLFSYTSFARSFMGAKINKFYPLGSKVIVNSTIQFDESAKSSILRQKIRQEMVKVISNRNQNIGESQLYVDGPLNPVPAIEDLNECADSNLNDCSSNGHCENLFGTFRCSCNAGFIDKYANDQKKSGKLCSSCSPDYCNNHGICIISNGLRECRCRGNYMGSKCEIDGEVLGVAIGASVAAVIIIVLTFVCLCVWNRRWKRDQHKAEMASVPSMASYGNKSITPINTYRLTIEDRVRWAHIADAMGNSYMPNERPGRPHPNKTEREDNYYGHPGRPKPRMCVSNTPPSGYYNQDFFPRDAYHPLSNRMMHSGSRPYYN